MAEVLCQSSDIHEVLWNFGRFPEEKRLTLKQNPHFYKISDLPMLQRAYVGKFEIDPTYDFRDSSICVLTDKPGRVFLNTGGFTRAFGNFWKPNEAIIFKGQQIGVIFSLPFIHDVLLDVCGKVEGESIVHTSMLGAPNAWYLDKLPLSKKALRDVPQNRTNPPSTITASPTASVVYGPFHDWREPLRQGSIPLHTNVRITDSPQGSSRKPLSELRNNTSSTAPEIHGSAAQSVSPPSQPRPIVAPPLNDRALPIRTVIEPQELPGPSMHPLVLPPTEGQARLSLTHLQLTVPHFRPRFQPSSFIKYMKNSGRVYRNQAMTLISLCRTFVQSQEQNPDSDATLRL